MVVSCLGYTDKGQIDRLSEKDRQRVATFVDEYAGIQLPPSKHSLVESRLRKRQRYHKLPSIAAYIKFVFDTAEGESEQIYLIDALTTNKTDFYREPEHFQFLNQQLLHGLQQNPRLYSSSPLSLWSAGCSTGEEPYTLSIELNELKRQFEDLNFSILATDISINCLQTAKSATYEHQKIEPVPLGLRKRYILRSKDKSLVKMSTELREKIQFQSFNLLTQSFPFTERFDVIFCRNVMIYFNQQDRSDITHQFSRCLKPRGLLLIGHSETLSENQKDFERVKPTIYRKAQRAIR